jgi:DNA-binding SARP family transcriptional activator
VPLDVALEELWPESDAATGRRRLRNVLNRIRAACGDLVVRTDGEALALGERVEVDMRLFLREAGEALAADGGRREALARAAVGRYGGELLPGDRYAAWAAAPREELRRRLLDLLDVLADEARDRGELDEAIRLLDQGIAIEPFDEARYLACAELLLLQRRRGSARSLVDRAVELRESLRLPPSPRLDRLVAATRPAAVEPA